MTEGPQHEKNLLKVITFSTAVSFGVLGAIMTSMNGFFRGDVSFHFSVGSVVGFILGFVAGWAFWKLIFWRRRKGEATPVSPSGKD
jgi:hypothetical protein